MSATEHQRVLELLDEVRTLPGMGPAGQAALETVLPGGGTAYLSRLMARPAAAPDEIPTPRERGR